MMEGRGWDGMGDVGSGICCKSLDGIKGNWKGKVETSKVEIIFGFPWRACTTAASAGKNENDHRS